MADSTVPSMGKKPLTYCGLQECTSAESVATIVLPAKLFSTSSPAGWWLQNTQFLKPPASQSHSL